MFMETSAKAGHNVKGLFKKIAMSLPGMEKDSAAKDNAATSESLSPWVWHYLIKTRNRCHFQTYERGTRGIVM